MNTTQHSVAANAQLDERGILVTCPQCGKRNRLKYEGLKQTFHCGQCHSELRPPSEPIDVVCDLAFEAVTSRSTIPILADFWAPWCGPCKMVAPELRKIAAEGVGRWLVIKVNTEDLPSLSQRFRVTAIPTMVLFQAGFEKARQAGAMPAPAIRRFLEPWVRA
jgi:thioredoxin 2